MPKFNRQPSPPADIARALSSRPDAVLNAEGGLAFRLDAKGELYQRVLNCLMGEAKFYEQPDETAQAIERLVTAIADADPEWVLKLAAHARQELYLRTVSIFLLVLAAELPACKPYVRKWAPQIIRRADEPAEVLAAWVARHGDIGSRGQQGGANAFPNSLKKGIADALANFDEYQLEKYNRDASVKFRDVLGVCRPDPGARQALYKYLRWDWDRLTEAEQAELPKIAALRALAQQREFGPEAIRLAKAAHATWEVLISQFGNKAEVWDALDLPFMAGLRNLRNLAQSGSTAALDRFLAQLQDESAVRRSRQYPFRYLAAYREIEKLQLPQAGRILGALSRALQLSAANLPRFSGTTLVACDNSGSMDHPLSAKSSVTRLDVANMLGALAHSLSDEAVVMSFGSDVAQVAVNPADSVFTNAERVRTADIKERGTNGFLVPAYLRGYRSRTPVNMYQRHVDLVKTHAPIRVDRMVIITDGQLYDSTGEGRFLVQQIELYRREVNPGARVYVIEIAGYGTTQVVPDDPLSVTVAGWSEQVLRFIPLFEQGAAVGVRTVDSFAPGGLASEAPLE